MILGFLVCPVATGAGAAIPPPQVSFIPHVTPVLITPTPLFSGLGPLEGGAVSVVGGFLWVGYASFPIGCEFQGGALIPTGSTTESATGLFGYSTIEGAPEYAPHLVYHPGDMDVAWPRRAALPHHSSG